MCAIAVGFICSPSTKETSKLFLFSVSQQCVCLAQGNAQETTPPKLGERALSPSPSEKLPLRPSTEAEETLADELLPVLAFCSRS